MNKNTHIITAAILCMLAAGCANAGTESRTEKMPDSLKGEEAPAASEQQTQKASADVTEQTQDTEGDILIRFEKADGEYKADDGTVLVTVERIWPVVEIPGREAASEALNAYVKDYTDQALMVPIEEIVSWAEEDYKDRGRENWNGYAVSISLTSARTDEAVISFVADSYSYMGGAHPNSVRAALNFDPKTGERLTLKDVTVDEAAAAETIQAFLLEQTKTQAEEGMFFEGYENNLKDIVGEDTWYLDEDGFHVIGNEYIISPHAGGILDFLIPYGQADFLKQEYL